MLCCSSHATAQQSQQVTRAEATAAALSQMTDADFHSALPDTNNRTIHILERSKCIVKQ